MNFIKQWLLGKAVKEMGEWIKNKLGKNKTTTILGILAIAAALAQGATAILDDDPNTKPDVQQIVFLLGGGTVAIKAREQGQHDKENQ